MTTPVGTCPVCEEYRRFRLARPRDLTTLDVISERNGNTGATERICSLCERPIDPESSIYSIREKHHHPECYREWWREMMGSARDDRLPEDSTLGPSVGTGAHSSRRVSR
jgi:hypothetical protein